jgi:hypothetical protein
MKQVFFCFSKFDFNNLIQGYNYILYVFLFSYYHYHDVYVKILYKYSNHPYYKLGDSYKLLFLRHNKLKPPFYV